MRKPILAIALVALFSCPTLASFAGTTSANSEQSLQGTSQASTSASAGSSRLLEDQPPLSKEAQNAAASSATSGSNSVSGSSGTGTAKSAPAAASSAVEPQVQVQTYAWTK
jgi:hypothetical protein